MGIRLSDYLIELGAHIGHIYVDSYCDMSYYILGVRSNFTIIDTKKTVPMIKSAIIFVEQLIANFGNLLFCYSGVSTMNLHLKYFLMKCIGARNQSFSH